MIFKNKFNLQLFAKKKVENENDDEIENDDEEIEEEEKPKKKKSSNKNSEISELKNIMGEVLECLKGKPELNNPQDKEIPIPKTPTPAQPQSKTEEVMEEVKENPILKFLKKLW